MNYRFLYGLNVPGPAGKSVPVQVRLPSMLMRDLGIGRQLTVQAGTLRELVTHIESEVPGFRDSICNELEQIRTHVNVFVNGVNVRGRPDALATPLRDGDRVHIFPSVAGGAQPIRVSS